MLKKLKELAESESHEWELGRLIAQIERTLVPGEHLRIESHLLEGGRSHYCVIVVRRGSRQTATGNTMKEALDGMIEGQACLK